MMALGMNRRTLWQLFMINCAIIGAISTGIGLVLGIIVALNINPLLTLCEKVLGWPGGDGVGGGAPP